MALGFVETVILGIIAGVTVYLGLPVAALRVSERRQGILTGFAIGVLVFLLVEIFIGVIEPVEGAIEAAVIEGMSFPVGRVGAAVVGLFVGLVGLAWLFDRVPESDPEGDHSRIAFMVAGGIGLHNFSEGLAIGQAAATGAASLALLLVVGFALHNVTEGFAIATPLVDEATSVSNLVVLGLVAGGPTFIGTIIGLVWVSPVASVLFLALAAGAILFVLPQLLEICWSHVSVTLLATTVVVGIFAGLATELIIEISLAT